MAIKIWVDGAWRLATPFVRANSAWRELSNGYVRTNGAWEPFWPEGSENPNPPGTREELLQLLADWSQTTLGSQERTDRETELATFNTSEITDISDLYRQAISAPYSANSTVLREEFNVDISGWDLSSATNAFYMLYNFRVFNQDISSWDTSSMLDMGYMFYNAYAFNQPIGSWDTSSALEMNGMFSGASSFNQSIDSWDTSSVAVMDVMFSGATSFNQPLNSWDVSNVIDMSTMFNDAISFDQPLNNWNTSSVQFMDHMFEGAEVFNQDISSWNTRNVVDMNHMFKEAYLFNQPLNSWNVSKVEYMYNMFAYAHSFNQPLRDWDVSKVFNMSAMFFNALVFDQNISYWSPDISSQPSNFDTGTPATWTAEEKPWFVYTRADLLQAIADWKTSTISDAELADFNTTQITDFSDLNFGPTFNVDISKWSFRAAASIDRMFEGASSFNQDMSMHVLNATRVDYDLGATSWQEANKFRFLESNSLDLSTVDLTNVTTPGDWVYEDNSLKSKSPNDVHNSSIDLDIVLPAGCLGVEVTYTNNSEVGYDGLYIYTYDSLMSLLNSEETIYNSTGTAELIADDTYILRLRYSKDGSVSSGEDRAIVSSIVYYTAS